MNPGIEIGPGVCIAETDLRWQTSRSGGPGGQNVNKVNTRVEVWIPVENITGLTPAAQHRLRTLAGRKITSADDLHLVGQTERSQEANRQQIFDRLRELIVRAQFEPKPRRKTRPSKAAKRRRLDSKHLRGELKAQRKKPVD